MKKLCLIFLLSTSLIASQPLPVQKLIDIQLEISYLAAKRNRLINNLSVARHTEVNDEVRGMQNMRDNRWSKFISELNEAQKYETLEKEDRHTLRGIDARILQLNDEAAALLSPSRS